MSAHDMGSWIITLTFFATSGYLIYEDRTLKALNIASALGTALIMCFGGLLFTSLVQYLATETGARLTNEILLGALVPIGVLVCLSVRRLWNRHLR